jgi:hypothetical protein
MEDRTMHRFATRPIALTGLLALTLAGAALADAVPQGAPAAEKSPGIVRPAPIETADTLRLTLSDDTSPAASPDRAMMVRPTVPLLLDPAEFGFGTTVVFTHMPDVEELHDVGLLPSVQHVVVSLRAWPSGFEVVQPLGQAVLPEGSDLIVILPGYPPTHAAAEAWNYLRAPLRLVLVVSGPPADRGGIDELNRIRALERVVADMEHPARSGFERLQRPLSFRVVMP